VYPNGYNFESGGNANKEISPKTRQKMSDAAKGRKMSEKTKKSYRK